MSLEKRRSSTFKAARAALAAASLLGAPDTGLAETQDILTPQTAIQKLEKTTSIPASEVPALSAKLRSFQDGSVCKIYRETIRIDGEEREKTAVVCFDNTGKLHKLR